MNKKTFLLMLALILIQGYTAIQLTRARLEINQLKDESRLHDEMLETLGDDVTKLEKGK